MPVAFSELRSDFRDVVPIQLRAPISVLPAAMFHPASCSINHQNLRVIASQPDRGRGAWRAQDHFQPFLGCKLDVLIESLELKVASWGSIKYHANSPMCT